VTRRALVLLGVIAGCNAPASQATPPDLGQVDPLALSCTDSLDDVYQLPPDLPAWDASQRGDVFRCAFERKLSADDVNQAIVSYGYLGPAVANDVDVYRIAYRTERSTPVSGTAPAGYSSARVFLPATPRADAFVVTAHGTNGLAAGCVDSQNDLQSGDRQDDHKMYNLALAGDGWIVIAPDFAGYGYGQAPPGWFLAEDEAKSVLDATRALTALLLPSATPPKVALVGHSGGSHAVLAAQGMAHRYGLAGELVGVAPLSLLWLSGQTWGAADSPLAGLNTQHDPALLSYSLFFFYGHGELYDGPGGGLAMFQAAKRDQVKALLTGSCEADMSAMLPALGTSASDFYDPAFVSSLSDCMLLQTNCDLEPAKTWKARALADRPPVDPAGAPIVIWHGALDQDIPPARAQCGIDKLTLDLGPVAPTSMLTVCGDSQADHSGVPKRDIHWISQWIGTRANGQPNPDGCPGVAPLQPPGGGALTCATPPAND
jgi:hypothetical protein